MYNDTYLPLWYWRVLLWHKFYFNSKTFENQEMLRQSILVSPFFLKTRATNFHVKDSFPLFTRRKETFFSGVKVKRLLYKHALLKQFLSSCCLRYSLVTILQLPFFVEPNIKAWGLCHFPGCSFPVGTPMPHEAYINLYDFLLLICFMSI